MQHLEVSGAVRPLQSSLGVKGLNTVHLRLLEDELEKIEVCCSVSGFYVKWHILIFILMLVLPLKLFSNARIVILIPHKGKGKGKGKDKVHPRTSHEGPEGE